MPNPLNQSVAETFKPGDKLAGCYVLKEIIPLGGAGLVWLAHDEELNKDLALHFVPDAVAADTRAMSELKQEAKRNRQLIHPRIVRVYDLLEEDKWAAISMDHVQGETLASLLGKKEKGAFNPSEISGWLSEICQTLEDAHRVDMIHRDLAPDNLLVTPNGLMVLKFGLSRVVLDSLARAGQKIEGGRDLAYISPQQLDGERASREDDIYSLGAVVYHLLTGAPPFKEGDLITQIRKTVPPPVSTQRSERGIQGEPIPAKWDKTIAASLQKSREDRPKRAAELGADLALAGGAAAAAAAAAPAQAPEQATEEKSEKAAEKAKDVEPSEAAKPAKRSWGPSKPPVITEATVLSKTSLGKTEKSDREKVEAAAVEKTGPEKKTPGPTTPSGFPLRAFVEVDKDARPKNGKTPVALFATGGVLLLLLIIGYVVSRNSGNTGGGSENGIAASSTNSDLGPAPEEGGTPAPEAASSPAEATPAPEEPAASATPENANTIAAIASPVPSATAAAPVAEQPAPTAAGSTPNQASPPSATDIASAIAQAKTAVDAAEKEAQAKAAAQAQAAAAAKEAQQAIQQKNDAAAAAQKAADAAAAALQQQQADLQKAEAEAQDAQKMAAAKAQAADALRAKLQDAQAAVQKQQAAQKQAQAEAAEMSKMVADRQQQAEAAAKAAADAEAARQKQAQELQAVQSRYAEQQANMERAQRAQEAERAAEAAAKLQQQRAAESERLAAQAAAAAKAAQDAEKALAAARQAVEDAEKARVKAEQAAAAARAGTAPAAASPTPAAASPAPNYSAPPRATAVFPQARAASPAPGATLTVRVPNPHSKVDATLENSLGMRFAPVGSVLFGVWLTRVQDFAAFAKATGFKSTAWQQPGFRQGPDHPVVNVSWNDAMQFCLWLTEKEHNEGNLALNETYRLPTDLEWSKAVGLPEEAARTPEARDMDVPDIYPWGTQWPPPAGAGNYTGEETDSDVAIKGYNDGFAWTSPVGSFNPNKYGLYDVGGNVWEWCMDWWNPEQKAKVLRGGSWYNGALKLSLLSSCRIHAAADSQTDNYGFRVVIANEMSKPKLAKHK